MWFGPNAFSAPSVEMDLHVGGAYRIAMQPPEGEVFYLVELLDVDLLGHLSYTFRWEDPDPEDRETIVTLRLNDVGGTTSSSFRKASLRPNSGGRCTTRVGRTASTGSV